MTFSAAGSVIQTTTASLTTAPSGVGNGVIFSVITVSATVWATAIAGGNYTWTQVGSKFTGTTNAATCVLFSGTATASGSSTATITFNGTLPTVRSLGVPFASSVGSWAIDGAQGNLDSASTSALPSLTPAGPGDLYFGFFDCGSSPAGGGTTGYTFGIDAHSNGYMYDLACTSGAQAPTWSGLTSALGIAVLLREAAAAVKPGIFNRQQAVTTAATR